MKYLILIAAFIMAGCSSDAQIASHNLSKAADMFEIDRRIVFYNGITGEYMLVIEGRCSFGSGSSTVSLTVTCKHGPNDYKKHFLGLSDNVTFFSEQVNSAPAGVYHYRVIFKPQALLPNVDFSGSITGR
jgi:hypothetical protein